MSTRSERDEGQQGDEAASDRHWVLEPGAEGREPSCSDEGKEAAAEGGSDNGDNGEYRSTALLFFVRVPFGPCQAQHESRPMSWSKDRAARRRASALVRYGAQVEAMSSMVIPLVMA